MSARTLVYHAFNLAVAAILAARNRVPVLVPVGFALMLVDALQGTARPPVGACPAAIGVRQLAASTAFVAVMFAASLT